MDNRYNDGNRKVIRPLKKEIVTFFTEPTSDSAAYNKIVYRLKLANISYRDMKVGYYDGREYYFLMGWHENTENDTGRLEAIFDKINVKCLICHFPEYVGQQHSFTVNKPEDLPGFSNTNAIEVKPIDISKMLH